MYPPFASWYENCAPFVARIIFGCVFLFGATGKIPGTEMYAGLVAYSDSVGLPMAGIAVVLAGLLEFSAGLMLILGWHARIAAIALAAFMVILTVVFHWSFASQDEIGAFISHLVYIAGLLYISVHGARSIALRRDQ